MSGPPQESHACSYIFQWKDYIEPRVLLVSHQKQKLQDKDLSAGGLFGRWIQGSPNKIQNLLHICRQWSKSWYTRRKTSALKLEKKTNQPGPLKIPPLVFGEKWQVSSGSCDSPHATAHLGLPMMTLHPVFPCSLHDLWLLWHLGTCFSFCTCYSMVPSASMHDLYLHQYIHWLLKCSTS